MKRSILSAMMFVIVLVFANVASAQMQVGILGGAISTQFTAQEDNPFDADPNDFYRKTDYGFGVAFEYKLSKYFSLRTEPMYLKKSNLYTQDDDVTENTYKVNYLELPFYFKVSYGNTLKPYVFAGPAIAYRLSAEADVDNSGILGTADIKHITKDFDIAAKFGAGVSYDFGFGTLFVQGLYSLGFTNINEGGDIEIDIQGFTITEEVDALEIKLR